MYIMHVSSEIKTSYLILSYLINISIFCPSSQFPSPGKSTHVYTSVPQDLLHNIPHLQTCVYSPIPLTAGSILTQLE